MYEVKVGAAFVQAPGFFAHFATRNRGAWAVARGGGAATGSLLLLLFPPPGVPKGGTRPGGAARSPGLVARGAPGRAGRGRAERAST